MCFFVCLELFISGCLDGGGGAYFGPDIVVDLGGEGCLEVGPSSPFDNEATATGNQISMTVLLKSISPKSIFKLGEARTCMPFFYRFGSHYITRYNVKSSRHKTYIEIV